MPTQVTFGAGSKLELDLSHAHRVLDPQPTLPALPSLPTALRQALDHPLEFPPLAQVAYPGDRVTVALEPAVPQVAAAVAAVVETLLTNGVSAGDITLLQAGGSAFGSARDPRRELAAELRETLPWLTHDPQDKHQLAFLGYSLEGQAEPQPVYLHRALLDADVMISIASARAGISEAEQITASGLFPMYSDQAAQQRIRAQITPGHAARGLTRARELVHDAQRLLGAVFSLTLVPAAAGQVASVYAGEMVAVHAAGHAAAQQAWGSSVAQRCDLVIAAIDEAASQGGWHFIGRALAAAARIVTSGGAIAIGSDLRAALGPALRAIKGAENAHQILRRLERKPPEDWFVARQLVDALDHARIYLLSRMEESIVEELGLAYVRDVAEIGRLARQYPTCCVLRSAQYAWPTPDETLAEPHE